MVKMQFTPLKYSNTDCTWKCAGRVCTFAPPSPSPTRPMPSLVYRAMFLYCAFLLLFHALKKSTGTRRIVWRCEFPLRGRDPSTSAE